MVSLDVYRPAAQEQLKFLGEQNNILHITEQLKDNFQLTFAEEQ